MKNLPEAAVAYGKEYLFGGLRKTRRKGDEEDCGSWKEPRKSTKEELQYTCVVTESDSSKSGMPRRRRNRVSADMERAEKAWRV